MAISVVSKTHTTYNTDSPSVTIPSDTVQADDIILVWLSHGNDENCSIDDLNGNAFTEICDDLQSSGGNDQTTLAAILRSPSGGEENDSITATAVSSRKGLMGVIVLRGVDDTTAIDTAVTHASHHLADNLAQPEETTAAFPSYSTTTDGAWVFEIMTYRASAGSGLSDITTDASGTTNWFKQLFSAADDIVGLATYRELASAGAAGGTVFTCVDEGTAEVVMQLIFALRPASGGGPSDPEGPLIGGKLVGGGILMRGRLVT